MQEAYNQLRTKFSLPEFELMDHEFEISNIDVDKFPLREVLKRLEGRLEYLTAIHEEILQPTPDSLQQMHECKHFSQDEKVKVYEIYKRVQHLSRSIIEAHIMRQDTIYAQTITKIVSEWPQLREDTMPFILKMKESWKMNDEDKDFVEYFG